MFGKAVTLSTQNNTPSNMCLLSGKSPNPASSQPFSRSCVQHGGAESRLWSIFAQGKVGHTHLPQPHTGSHHCVQGSSLAPQLWAAFLKMGLLLITCMKCFLHVGHHEALCFSFTQYTWAILAMHFSWS